MKTFTRYEEKSWLREVRRRGAAIPVKGLPPDTKAGPGVKFVPVAIAWEGLDGGLRWSELP